MHIADCLVGGGDIIKRICDPAENLRLSGPLSEYVAGDLGRKLFES
jgi:hypothetical protein